MQPHCWNAVPNLAELPTPATVRCRARMGVSALVASRLCRASTVVFAATTPLGAERFQKSWSLWRFRGRVAAGGPHADGCDEFGRLGGIVLVCQGLAGRHCGSVMGDGKIGG
jgi:hypothetical protein